MLMLVGGFALPAMAVTAPSPLTVSQVPSIYSQKGIAPNLFLLLDDSGSMQYEHLGSNSDDNDISPYGYPIGTAQPYGGATYCQGAFSSCTPNIVPGFAADNKYAAQYRAAYVNPNYYDPAVTYTPWACAAEYPESSDQTAPTSPITNYPDSACHWDSTVGLWVMADADPNQAYLNPAKASQGYRSVNVWNDSNTSTQKASNNGFAGDNDTYWEIYYCNNGGNCGYYYYQGTLRFWPATYFNYFGSMPGAAGDYANTANYQRVQICPATATTNSSGTVSTTVCTPPPTLATSPLPYHTYVGTSGDYVFIKGDGTQITRTPTEAMQNFANWFQYYRSHILMANGGIGIAFMQLPTTFRVDFGVISKVSQNQGFTGQTGVQSTENFTLSEREKFLPKLYGQSIPPQGTPNRSALYYLGQWFADPPNSSPPWGSSQAEQAQTGETVLSCRSNYALLMTDGMWNGTGPGLANVDGTAGSAITDDSGNSYQYEPAAPYEDTWSDTLADVAMKYWNSDLQTGAEMPNNVPVNSQDGAFWQHMTTFTVGLGVQPTLVQTYMTNHSGVDQDAAQAAVFQELLDGTASWPEPSANSPNNIDDTWHAAIDGHGTYASAGNPTELYQAISDALVNIVNRTGAASSLSVNTEKAGQTRTRQQVYQALFHPQNWWGDVLALPVVTTQAPNSSTVVVSLASDADWSASCVLTGGHCPQMGLTNSGQPENTVAVQDPSTRTILTWAGSSAAAFSTTLPASAVSVIGGTAVVNYIRGVRSTEAAQGGTLRSRTSVMGDVVLSSPIFVGAPGSDYPNTWINLLNLSAAPAENQSGAQTYSAFIAEQESRKPVVYVGANDGMLHGFYAPSGATAANAGKELLAYVPNAVWGNLADYASTSYTHHYFVNATPGVGDLFYGGSWHTWLVGGEGAGGTGTSGSIFVLDITDPGNFSESNPAATVVGEWAPGDICSNPIGSCNGNDLGLTFGTPVITRFNNGKWGFVFGNGFNSATGVAAIFIAIVDAAGNVAFRELTTNYGPAQDPNGATRPNGIGFVTPVDLNGDHTADYVYAGDYFGNVWRFNITASNPAEWGPDFANGSGPMFAAANADATAQPITTKVLVVAVPGAGAGFRVMVEFGTGAAITDAEQAPNLTAAGVQSLYGVWDWDFSGWNSGQPSASVDARQPAAYQYASLATGPTGAAYTRLELGVQSITKEQTTSTVQGGINNNRVVSQNPICWKDTDTVSCMNDDKYGWYLDLTSPAQGAQGEKVVYNPVLRSGVFLVNTTIPNTASGLTCQAATNVGWTMALNPESGGRLPYEVFDTTGNGKFEQITLADDGSLVNTSGITLGAVGSPGFVTYAGDTFLVFNTGSGEAEIEQVNIGSGNLAAQLSWQELR